jgi:serine/threonine protein kinase
MSTKLFRIAEGLENMGAIKTGGQGSVYKGKRIGEITTAIKLLPTPILAQDENDKHYRDFNNEVTKLQRVNEEPNPNIVKFLSYGVSETGCFPYIEMEYIDGPDLCDLLKQSSIFTVKETIKIAEQLAHALAHCHRLDVKHGDIKTNNVKFNKHTGNYVLIDFGLAILSDEERRTSLRRAGAIEFMAPEQNEGDMYFETDVYSFGIVVYELMAGRVPFPLDGNSETARNKVMLAHMETPPPNLMLLRQENIPQEWDNDTLEREMVVPDWLLSLIHKCLEKKPEDRYKNGEELYEAIFQHSTQFSTIETTNLLAHANADEVKSLRERLREREDELESLKAEIARAETLEMVHHSTDATSSKGISKGTFAGLLATTILLALFTVYSLFFNSRTAGAVSTDNNNSYSDTSVNNGAARENENPQNETFIDNSSKNSFIPSDSGGNEIDEDEQVTQQEIISNDVQVDEKPSVQKPVDTVGKKLTPPDIKPSPTDTKKEEPKKDTTNGIQ